MARGLLLMLVAWLLLPAAARTDDAGYDITTAADSMTMTADSIMTMPIDSIVVTTDSIAAVADSLSIRDVFRDMPAGLLPTLSENNRLDMIDFIDSHMKAEVSNLAGGKSEMLSLSTDSLTLRVSTALRVSLFMLKPLQPADSCDHVVAALFTYGTAPEALHTVCRYYTPKWKELALVPQLSDADKKRLLANEVQTILKLDAKILKKE